MRKKPSPAGFLADTGIWIDVERGVLSAADLSAVIGELPTYGSPISVAELSHAVGLVADPAVRSRRQKTLDRLMEKVIVPIDSGTSAVFGQIAAALTRGGRGSASHRVQDLWMAAQAIQHKLRLLTFNRKDFDDIPGLDVHILQHAARGA